MTPPQQRPRIRGSAVAIALAYAVVLSGCSGASAPDILNTGTTPSSPPVTSADPLSSSDTNDSDPAADNTAPGIPVDAFTATVTYVHDGDTLFLDDGNTELKVRLIGIDTPELSSQQRPDAGECYGEEARELLRDFLPVGTAVWAVEDLEPTDRYGRSLLYVYLTDATLVNLAMIELGAAEAVKVGLNDRYWSQLRAAEVDAQAQGLGQWGRC